MERLAVVAVGAPNTTPLIEPNDAVTVIVNEDKRSLAAIGNEWLDKTDCEVFGLCHTDVTFGPGALDIFYAYAAAGEVCGIVGVDADRNYRWARAGTAPVSTLDACAVFFRKDFGLRFDAETFDGFHCHVEDLCLAARDRGIQVVVPAADADHRGASTSSRGWQADCTKYRNLLRAKWAHSGKYELV